MTDKNRHFRYLVNPGVSLAVDVDGGLARIAVALCDENDQFSRATGAVILNHLLDSDDITLRALRLQRNVFTMPFRSKDKTVSKDLMQPLLEFLADRLNERTLYRGLRQLFLQDITTKEDAQAAAKVMQSEAPFKRFKMFTDVLEKEEVEIFGEIVSLEDFQTLFFDWSGSANAILDGVHLFTRIAQFRDREEGEKLTQAVMRDQAPEDAPEKAPAAKSDETQRIAVVAEEPEATQTSQAVKS